MTAVRRKDLEVTVQVRNNQIKARRIGLGLSQKQLATAADIAIGVLQGFEGMVLSPTKVHRDYHCRAAGCVRNVFRGDRSLFCGTHRGADDEQRAAWEASYVGRPEVLAWTLSAQKLARFFDVDPEELFPESIKNISANKAVKTMDVPELMAALGIASGEPAALPMLDGVEAGELSDAIRSALGQLTPRQRDVVERRFGLSGSGDETQAMVGDLHNVSTSRLAQIESNALGKLRKALREWQ